MLIKLDLPILKNHWGILWFSPVLGNFREKTPKCFKILWKYWRKTNNFPQKFRGFSKKLEVFRQFPRVFNCVFSRSLPKTDKNRPIYGDWEVLGICWSIILRPRYSPRALPRKPKPRYLIKVQKLFKQT